jgi:hypothetical protein
VPALRLDLQISRLSGKGDYSTRPSGTTNSLIIWVEVYVASITLWTAHQRLSLKVQKPVEVITI